MKCVLNGLDDRMDDVSAAAADVLVPVAPSLAEWLSADEMSALREMLWSNLAKDDDLSAATACILHLLWKLYSTADEAHDRDDRVKDHVPLLFQFFSHPLMSVRTSVVQCFHQLLTYGAEIQCHFQRAASLIFFNLLTEVNEEILQLNEEAWKSLIVAYADSDLADDFDAERLTLLIQLAVTPIGSHLDKTAVETLIGAIGDHNEKLTVGSQSAGNPFRMRFAVSLALAIILKRQPEQLHLLCESAQSDSATSRLVFALVGHFWHQQNNNESIDFSVWSQSEIFALLERETSFSELCGYETKLRKEHAAFLTQLSISSGSESVAGHVDVEALPLDAIESQATTLLLSVQPSVYDSMAGLHQQVIASSRKLTELRQTLKIQVNASAAAILVDRREIPAKLNCVVQPLMAGIRTEKETILRKLFAVQLAKLIVLCHNRRSAVQKMIGNVCRMACDTEICEFNQDLCEAIDREGLNKALGVISLETTEQQTVTERGAATVLQELTKNLSTELFSVLPALWTEMTDGLNETSPKVAHCIAVLQIVGPGMATELLPHLAPLLAQICRFCFSEQQTLRVIASRCCARLGVAHTEIIFPLILEQLAGFLSVHCNNAQREGAVIALHHLLEALGECSLNAIVCERER